MRVATDYIRHAARAARKCAGDPFGGAPEAPDPEFYKTLAKALEEIAAGMAALGKEECAPPPRPPRPPLNLPRRATSLRRKRSRK